MSDQSSIVMVDRAPAPGDEVRALIKPHVVEIIAKLVELAKAGDPRSLDLVLRYIAPQAKQDAERIAVPGLKEAPTVKAKSEAIINAVANGLISVEAGERVARLLELHTKAVTVGELADEIAALKLGRAPLRIAQRVDDNFDLA